MPERLVKTTVQIHRDGLIVQPEIGKVFKFTAEEVDAVNKLNKKALVPVEKLDAAPAKTVEAKKA